MRKILVDQGSNWELFKVMEHYELWINGEFWSSGDSRRECYDELEKAGNGG